MHIVRKEYIERIWDTNLPAQSSACADYSQHHICQAYLPQSWGTGMLMMYVEAVRFGAFLK